MEFVPIADIPARRVDALLDAAFGPARRARTAYRIRIGMLAVPELSTAALVDGALVGTIQCWPIALRADSGHAWPLVMVGPVAVTPDRQREGLGRQLMEHLLAAAACHGEDERLMLIGDPEYYGRFFGFTADRTGRWRTPGPVERHRLLARGQDVPDLAGMLGPRAHALDAVAALA